MNNLNNWSNVPTAGAQSWYQPSYQNEPNTNVYKVTSLEEAIMRSNVRPSETVYFHQSKNEFYNVRVDINGNKTWQTFFYGQDNGNTGVASSPSVTKEMYDEIIARISALEGKHKEVSENAQSNG